MPLSGVEARMQNLDGTMWRLIEAYAFDDDGHQLPLPRGNTRRDSSRSEPHGSLRL